MSYNQWLNELRKVSLEERKIKGNTIAVFREMKDFVILKEAEPKDGSYGKRDLDSEQKCLAARASLQWNQWPHLVTMNAHY